MAWSTHARGASQLFFAAVGAYLINSLVGSRLIYWVAEQSQGLQSTVLQLLLAAAAVDLSKLIGLSVAALLVGHTLRFAPQLSAGLLLGLSLGWELAVSGALGQVRSLYMGPAATLARLAMVLLLFWVLSRIFRWRHRAPPAPEAPTGETPAVLEALTMADSSGEKEPDNDAHTPAETSDAMH